MSKDTNKKEKKEQKNNFMKELKAELKKVTWPSRKELITNTMTVIVITIIIATIVFVLDFTFEKLYTFGVGNLKNAITASENVEENTETTEDIATDNTTTEKTVDANTTTDATTNTTEATAEQNQVTENTANTTAE